MNARLSGVGTGTSLTKDGFVGIEIGTSSRTVLDSALHPRLILGM